MLKKIVALFSLALAAVVAVGCGGLQKPGDMGDLGGCVVKVTQDGAPLEGAEVIFHAQDEANKKYTPSGRTNEKGEAKIKTYGFEGVPAGEYKVTVTKLVIEEGELVVAEDGSESVEGGSEYQVVDEQFRNVDTTPLTTTVTDPMTEVPTFDVGAAVEDEHK